jgi:hypothetical protein
MAKVKGAQLVLEVEDADGAGGIINRRRLDDNDEQSPLLRTSSFDSEREFGDGFNPILSENLHWYRRPSVRFPQKQINDYFPHPFYRSIGCLYHSLSQLWLLVV